MKKLMFSLIISGITAVSSLAFNFNSLSSMAWKDKNTIKYTIDTPGTNPRVYEFDTQGYPRMHCIVIFRDSTKTSPAMQCVLTKEEYIKMNKKFEK